MGPKERAMAIETNTPILIVDDQAALIRIAALKAKINAAFR